MTSKNQDPSTKVVLVHEVQRISDFETQVQTGTYIGVDWRGVYVHHKGVAYTLKTCTWFDSNEVTIECADFILRLVCVTVGAASDVRKLLDHYQHVPKRSWFLHDNVEADAATIFGSMHWRNYSTARIKYITGAPCLLIQHIPYTIKDVQVLDKHVMIELNTGTVYINVGTYSLAKDVLSAYTRILRDIDSEQSE